MRWWVHVHRRSVFYLLENFFEKLNTVHLTIKYTAKYSKEKIK